MRMMTVLGGLSLLALASRVSALSFTVDMTQDLADANPGDDICSTVEPVPADPQALCSLRAAIMEANAKTTADIILLQGGATYALTLPGRLEDDAATGDLDVVNSVTIEALPGDRAIIDAQGTDRVFHILASNVTLSNLELVGGDSVADEMQLHCAEERGGAIEAFSSNKLRLVGLSVHGNRQGVCSGAIDIQAGSVLVAYSDIFDNPKTSGITASYGSLSIENSSIHHSDLWGIGLSDGASLSLLNSTVSTNPYEGISCYYCGSVTIANSTIVNNGKEGMDMFSSSQLTITNSILAKNYTVLGLKNCALYNNSDVVFRGNLYDDHSCTQSGPDDDSLHDLTAFLSLLGWHGGPTPSHRPLTISPAIDANESAVCGESSQDQRDEKRPVAFTSDLTPCDIGAIELEGDLIFFDPFEWL